MAQPKGLPVFSMRSPHFTVVLLHGTLPFKIFKPRMLQWVIDTYFLTELGVSLT